MEESHVEDVRNIEEGDFVTAETTKGETIEMTCEVFNVQNSPDPEAIQKTKNWTFFCDTGKITIQITDGLRRFDWEAEYPRHNPMYHMDREESLGYVEDLQIHGELGEPFHDGDGEK